MFRRFSVISAVIAVAAVGFVSNGARDASATTLKITFENLAPSNGFFFTPVYGAFHGNTGFDLFNVGDPASPLFESLAEDGNFGPLRDDRVANFPNSQGVALNAGVGPIGPQSSASAMIDVDGSINSHFVFATMLIPSQDAFIGLDQSVMLFDTNGKFIRPFSLTFDASDIYDAGTEDNSDNANVAFLNQAAPNLGADENGVIALHGGLSDAILDAGFVGPGGAFAFDRNAADFTQSNFGPVARITITAVPEPSSMAGLGLALLGLAAVRHRRKRNIS